MITDSHIDSESFVTMEFNPTGTANVASPCDRDVISQCVTDDTCGSDPSSSVANANDPSGDASGVACWKPLVPLKPPWFYEPPDGY